MSRVLLSRAARLDRRALTGFTVERFGVRQARRLRARFETVLSMLADAVAGSAPSYSSPIGTSVPEIPEIKQLSDIETSTMRPSVTGASAPLPSA